MPIYEYQCEQCGHQLEVLQAISEKPLHECPLCHQMTLNKLISPTSFQLKGTGWYATDFRDKGKPKETKTTDGTPSSQATSESTSTETTTVKTDEGTSKS